MDKVASEIMGEPVIVGVTVATQGEAAKMVRGAGGGIVGAVVGGAVAAAMAGKPTTAATPGNHIGPMFLTLGATKLAFFTLKQGFFKNSA